MKYTLVIVAYKAREKLIKCLESLANHAPEADRHEAEIILIDNSPERLVAGDAKLFKRLLHNYSQMIEEWHPENLGFAAACNRGVELSQGDNIILINPDTEVFPEWAARLAAHINPTVGAVGPVSNFVAGFQRADYHQQVTEDWAKTARIAARGNNKRGMDTRLLIGFFMMIPRTVWDKVGGMDPQFFLGCDDLDLSMRIREAGYNLIIASDVFIYHEGHASFKESTMSLELNKQSEKRLLAKLKAKYGDKIPTSTDLWGCEILPTYAPKRQTLSVCMIVRDDLDNMDKILKQIQFADEIVIAETEPNAARAMGSAQGYTGYLRKADSIHFFPWTDNFASARNYALSKCTSDWVLWLDADDRVTPESAQLIRAALDHPGPMTQAKTCHFGLMIRDDGPDGFNFAKGQPRLFPRIPGIEWSGRVHESYMPATEAMGIVKVDCDNIIIDHTGYKDPSLMLKKHARNLRLMRMEEDSPKKFYHMAKNLQALGHYLEAEHHYLETLSDRWAKPLDNVFRDQVRACMASLIITVKGADESVDQYLEGNEKPDAAFLRAEVAFKRGDIFKAERIYTEYAALEWADDPYGSQLQYFQAVARDRLQTIADARKKVFGVPA
ncbi:MAG: glycosyltransferase family 2 protein [Fibrobacterota bacterium]|nr:glycosyltransferase family 2 protein [Fibrobacterota bacterium]